MTRIRLVDKVFIVMHPDTHTALEFGITYQVKLGPYWSMHIDAGVIEILQATPMPSAEEEDSELPPTLVERIPNLFADSEEEEK
jgi:hypothetical protein